MSLIELDLELIFEYVNSQIQGLNVNNSLLEQYLSSANKKDYDETCVNSNKRINVVESVLDILNVVLSEKGYTDDVNYKEKMSENLIKTKKNYVVSDTNVVSVYFNYALSDVVNNYSKYNEKVLNSDQTIKKLITQSFVNNHKRDIKTLNKCNKDFKEATVAYSKINSKKSTNSNEMTK